MEIVKKTVLFLHIFFVPLAAYEVIPLIPIDFLFLGIYLVIFLFQHPKGNYNKKSILLIISILLFSSLILISSSINNVIGNYNDVLFIFLTVLIYLSTDLHKKLYVIKKSFIISVLFIALLVFIRGFEIVDVSGIIGIDLKLFSMFKANIFGMDYTRNYGLFQNSGPFALYIVGGYSFLLDKYLKNFDNKYILPLLTIITIVVLSLSRNAFLVIATSSFLLINFSQIKYKYWINIAIILIGAITLYIFAQLNALLGDDLLETSSRAVQFQGLSLDLILGNLLWGIGSYMEYDPYMNYELHNVYIMLLVNFGLLSFLAFCSYLGYLFGIFFYERAYKSNPDLFVIFLCALLSINFFTGLFIREFWLLISIVSLVIYNQRQHTTGWVLSPL